MSLVEMTRAFALETERTRHGELARMDESDGFPFEAWARNAGYPYQREWTSLLRKCGSAAEVYFLRPFLERATVDGETARAGHVSVTLQHPVKQYQVDVLIDDGSTRLAVEIDGMAFHHRSREQIAADYLRQRRITARGYTVIRFTSHEAFTGARECWRQVDAILDARRK